MNDDIKRLIKKCPRIVNYSKGELLTAYIDTQTEFNRAMENLKSINCKMPIFELTILRLKTEQFRLIQYLIKKGRLK